MDARDFRFKEVADVRAGHHAAVLSSRFEVDSTGVGVASGVTVLLAATPARMSIREA
jgi:hypothetical protein